MENLKDKKNDDILEKLVTLTESLKLLKVEEDLVFSISCCW